MRAAGLSRSDAYVCNVLPYLPEVPIEKVPKAEIAHWEGVLHHELGLLADPIVLVPLGNIALHALTGEGGIFKRRGSLAEYRDAHGHPRKVIGTLHPAAVLRTPTWGKRCRADWRRIATDLGWRELRLPVREHLVRPTLGDVEDFVSEAIQADCLAIDIETPRERHTQETKLKSGKPGKPKIAYGDARITCVGVSDRPDRSLTIPTTSSYWKNTAALQRVWQLLGVLLLCEKAFHNGLFDTWWLAKHVSMDTLVRRWEWDTLAMHHALDPTEDHDLAFCASIDTREPYWKDEGRDTDEIDQFWTYCGKDAAVTRELKGVYQGRLDSLGRLDWYRAHYRDLFGPLLQMMLEGVRMDTARRQARFTALRTACADALKLFEWLAGEKLHGAKGSLSNVKLQRFLYETLKLPKQTITQDKVRKLTTREVAIRRLQLLRPSQFAITGDALLAFKRQDKLSTFFSDHIEDPDGRVRCTYKFDPETGQLASAKNPNRTGMNLQNVDREARDIFLPDPGEVFIELDASQIEARIVEVLTGDPEMIRRARLPAWEYDRHTANAARILGKPEAEVTKHDRYLGKKTVHGTHYGEGPDRLSDEMLKDGVVEPPERCQAFIGAYLDANAPIMAWQARVRQDVMVHRCLTNTWGRMLVFDDERLSEEVFRRAYAFSAHSEAMDLLKQWGIVPLWRWLRAEGKRSRLRLTLHDNVVLSCPRDEAWDVYQFTKASLERPRVYGGVALMVPAEVKVGPRWGEGTEWKRPPSREVFEAAVVDALQAHS